MWPSSPPPPPKQGSLCACWREGWGEVCSFPKLTKNSKNESVSEMSVQGKFDQVASDPKSSCGLYQRHENPPTDGSIKNSQWDAGDELLSARVWLGLQREYHHQYSPYNSLYKLFLMVERNCQKIKTLNLWCLRHYCIILSTSKQLKRETASLWL